MGVVLSKGGSVSLTKQASKVLSSVSIGLGWDAPHAVPAYDLDASIIAVDASGRAVSDAWFVFYNNLSSPDGSIRHSGDSRDGSESDGGDDEIIVVDLAALPPQVESVRVLVTIDEGEARGQTFGQVPNSYVRVVDNETNIELARFGLGDGVGNGSALIFAELVRAGGDWRFQAIGETHAGGLATLVTMHGIDVG